MEQITEIAQSIDSYVKIPEETDFLVEHARNAKCGIIEVGCWTGRSSLFLASVARELDITYVAVDTWTSCDLNPGRDFFPEWRDNMERAGLLPGFEMEEGPIGHGSTTDGEVVVLRMPSIYGARLFDPLVAYHIPPDIFPVADMLFIDADHEYLSVLADFAAWTEHILRGGTVVFHDIDQPQAHPGPGKFFEELIRAGYKGTRRGNIGAVTFEPPKEEG